MLGNKLVLIPGLCSDAAIWRRTITALGDGFDCIVGDTLSDKSLAAMAKRILDQAPQSFTLAGVSMGGMVALELMKLAPQRVTGLALLDTNARPDTFSRKLSRRLTNLAVTLGGDFARLARRGTDSLVHVSASEDVRKELVEMSVRVGASTYVRQNRAVLARGDLRKVLPHVRVPTLVMVGQEDRLTPVGLSREIQMLTPGSTLHVIPNCGHLPPIEKPEVVAGLLKQLIKPLPATTTS